MFRFTVFSPTHDCNVSINYNFVTRTLQMVQGTNLLLVCWGKIGGRIFSKARLIDDIIKLANVCLNEATDWSADLL